MTIPRPPVTPAHGRLFRLVEAAQYLGVSVYSVRTLIGTGELVAVRNNNGRLCGVYERDCDTWLATHRRAAQPTAPAIDDYLDRQFPASRHFA